MGGDDDDVKKSSNNRWLRYGKSLPESLEKTKYAFNEIDVHSPTNVALVFGRCLMYYVDVVLDVFVSVTYIEDGEYMWAAVTLCMFSAFICAEFVRSRDLAVNHDLSLLRTSVFMLPWNILFAKESPACVDSMISIQLDSLLNEGLFEAPSQLSFQLFVVMHVWGVHGQPSIVQLGSVMISIMSLGSASASTFDVPYIFLGKKSSRDMSMVSMVPYICARGFQLMYRVISLALMFLTLDVAKGGLLLLPMIAIRVYMLSPLYRYADGSNTPPPLPVLVGSLFSDGFFGDAHFREHLPKGGVGGSAGASGTSTTRSQVAPNQQVDDEEEDSINGRSSSSAAATPNLVINSSVRKESLRRVEPTPQGLSSGEKSVHESHGALPKKKQGVKREERRIRRAQKSLMVSEGEVCAEVKMVAWGILLVAVESWLCFAGALVNLDRFDVDPFVIGWMALAAGGCMLVRACLHWMLFYSPLKDVPRRAVPVIRGVFVVYVLLAVSIMGLVVETGIAPDDCFAVDCGPASQCIPLTGAYQCDCTEGRSEKVNGATSSKDVCIDIDECLVGTHSCHEDHKWCINTQGLYECGSCGVGSYASDNGECTVKICFNSGKLMPGQHKISSTQGGFTGHLDDGDYFGSAVAVLGDLDKDGVMDLAMGSYRDDDGDGDNSGAVYVVFMRTDGGVKAHQKISATQGGLVGALGGGDEFGYAMAGLGDLDKDGVGDMVVGARHDGDGGEVNAGAVYVVFLHANGTVKAGQKISKSRGGFTGWVGMYHNLGRSLAGVGDVNGDGVVDLVMGSWGGYSHAFTAWSDPDDVGGAVFVVMLEPNGMVKGHQMTTFNATCSQFGFPFSLTDEWASSLTGMGDLDGDGVPDIAVGAPGGGAVYLLMLARDGTTKDVRKIGSGHGGLSVTLESRSRFGSSMALLGDFNGDGSVDLAVGAAGDDDGGSGRGSIYVLLLSSNGTVANDQKFSSRRGGLLNNPLDDGDSFGWGLASLGDWDGDGAPDLLVGTHGDDDGGPDRGAVYLLEVPPGFVSPCSGDLTCVDTGPSNFSCVTDINECIVSGNNGGCEQLCYSHDGGTTCGCEAGFVLDIGGTCTAGNFTCTTGVLMPWEQKISSDVGGGPVVGDHDWFGFSAAPLGDVDGDGVTDLVVGAPNGGDGGMRRGAVYVLLLNPSGTVKSHRKISESSKGGLSSSLEGYDRFGGSVAGMGDINGDGVADMVVGAPGDNTGGGTNRGAVYVLFLSATGTVNVDQKISAVDGGLGVPLGDGGEFGASVASLGDLNGDGVVDLAVGARFDDDGGIGRGAVYVLLMTSNGTVAAEQKISATEGGFTGSLGDFDAFGSSLTAVGDVDGDGVVDLAVGAPYDDGGDGDRGAVYVLLMDPSGTVKGEHKISSTQVGLIGPLSIGDLFGGAVAGVGDLDGDGVVDLVVGASHDDDGGTNRGAVYVVLLQASGAVKAAGKISSIHGGLVGPLDDHDRFGSSVGFLGDLDGDGVMDIVVGSFGDDDGSDDGGAVYVLKVAPGFVDQGCPAGGMSETCGDVKAGCASWEDTTPSTMCERNNGGCEQQCIEDTAGAFLFCGCDDGFILDKDHISCIADTLCHPGAQLPGGETKISSTFGGLESPLSSGGLFGSAVARIGDLDGDGVEDLVVGAAGDDSVYVLFLHTTGAVKTGQKIQHTRPDDYFGYSVGGLGDLDGDGVVDLVVGAPLDDDYAKDAGALYVFLLHANGTVKGEQQITTNQGGLEHELIPGGELGNSVAGLGDLDGDGVGDMVAGAPFSSRDDTKEGEVWVLRLKSDGTVKQAHIINHLEGALSGGLGLTDDHFGASVGNLGDWNGDGVVDLVVGSYGDKGVGGSVVVLMIDQEGFVISELKITWPHVGMVVYPSFSFYFGISVAGVGDLDGDGVPDLVVGAPGEGGGEVYVLLLFDTGTVKAQHKINSEHGSLLHPLEEGDYFGMSLAVLRGGGEEQGGAVRLVMGASRDDDGGADRGAIYLIEVPPGYVPRCDVDASRDTCLNTGEGTSMCVEDYYPGSCEWNMGGCEQQCYDTASGNSWCGCDTGYFLDDDGATCADVDECETNNGGCKFACVNTIGGFSCTCDPGYELSSDGTVCSDINECGVDNGGCGTELCLNHAGGFWCGCHTLYERDSNDVCVDLNECAESNGGCEQFCVNHAGGFSCDCPVGYEVEVNGTCTDMDECAVANGGCGQLRCFNQPGSFSCGCDAGYDLNADGTDCIDLLCSSSPALLPGVTKISSLHGGLRSPVLSYGDMGNDVAWIGDVNGDMVPDLAVGASATNNDKGDVYIMMMTSSGTVKSDQKISSRSTGRSLFGFSVAGLGDVDGDGVPDIAVGAMWRGDFQQGAAYVMFLLPTGEVKGEQEIWSGQGGLVGPLDDYDAFGSAVEGLGDIDGDGVPDMVVGAKGAKVPDASGQLVEGVGAVYVLGLKASGEVKWEQKIMGVRGRVAVPDDAARFGWSVTALGDVNEDGVGDIAVGSFFDHDGGYRRGAVYVIFLSSDGTVKGEQKISSTEGGLVSDLDDNDRFGGSVSALGDIDGDGVPDLTVGAAYDSDSGSKSGAVYLLLLHADGTVKKDAKIRAGDLAPTWAIQNSDRFGMGLSAVRDFNGVQGAITLAVGTPRDDDGGVRRGAVYVIRVPFGFMGLCDTDAGETCVNIRDGSFSCTGVAAG